MAEDEMVGWHHQLDGHEIEQAPAITLFQRRHRDDQQEHEESFVTNSVFAGGSKLIKI